MGIRWWKKLFIIHLREKRVKQKIISTSSHPKFVSRLFLKNVKTTNCIENISFYGVLKNYLPLQFHRDNKIYDFISFTMTRSRASHTGFVNFWKIKIWEANQFFFQKIKFFAYFLFVLQVFTGKRSNIQKVVCDGLRQFNLLQNDVCFSLLGQKLWEEIRFSVQKCNFQEGVWM